MIIIKQGDLIKLYGAFYFMHRALLSNNWGMWWIGDVVDGKDDDIFADNGWKSEFDEGDDDIFIADCITFGKLPTFVVVGGEWPCEFRLMSARGSIKVQTVLWLGERSKRVKEK